MEEYFLVMQASMCATSIPWAFEPWIFYLRWGFDLSFAQGWAFVLFVKRIVPGQGF